MNIRKFSFGELTSNSKGKTSMSMCCAGLLILTGCIMGLKGAFDKHADSMFQGLTYAVTGAGLLGIRRYTNDKEISPEADPSAKSV